MTFRFVWLHCVLIALLVVACGTESTSEGDVSESEISYLGAQKNLFVENTGAIFNPDQGFYRSIGFAVTRDGISFHGKPASELANAGDIRSWDNYLANVEKDWSDSKRRSHEYTQIYHLRFDISALSKANNGAEDLEFLGGMVDDLDIIIKAFSDKELNVIVRFCYAPAFGDKADAEPSVEKMKQHIEAISSVLKKYEDTVTAIEVGLIGPWGEMHTSQYAKDGRTIPELMEAWLLATEGTDIPILVRTPRHIYQYIYNYLLNHEKADPHMKLEDIDQMKIPSTDKAYRLSLFNDGYLASHSDYGTYYDRASEVPWAVHLTDHGPYGGEVTMDSSGQKFYALTNTDAFNTLEEMYQMHLSYLNLGWNDKIIQDWNDTQYKGSRDTALFKEKNEYHFILTHMGYRLVLQDSSIALSKKYDRLKLALNLQNKGFGNLNRDKYISLIAVDQTSKEAVYFENLQKYGGETVVAIETAISLPPGAYDIYLRMASKDGRYAIQFANEAVWSPLLKANRVGAVEIR